MADLSLHAARGKVLEQTYVRKLTERTQERDDARLTITEQTQAAARARQDQDAQATKSAETARSLDDVQREREAQQAVELKRLEQDKLDVEARAQLERVAQDAFRLEQARQSAIGTPAEAPTESRFAAALAADAREVDPRQAAYREQNSFAGVPRGSIVDLEG